MNLKGLRSKLSGAALALALSLGVMVASGATAQAQGAGSKGKGISNVMLASGAMALAQYRDYDTRQGTWTESRAREYAYKLGYHTGYSESRQAQNRGHRGTYRDLPGYRNDTNGHRAFMGHQDDYRREYRRGYEAGFNDLRAGRQRKHDRADVERVLGASLDDVYRDDDDRWYDRDDNWWDRNWPNRRNDRDDDRYGNMSRQELYRIAQQNGYRDGLRNGREDRARNRRSDFDNHREYREAINGYRNEYRSREYYQQAYREGFRSGYEDGYRRNSGRRFPW